jgi:hypothetical protein
MTSQVGSAEEIGKLWRLQELVDLSATAISNRISSGSYTLVSVAGFDDPALRLFAKPVAALLLEAKVGRAVSCSMSNCRRSRVYFTIARGAADPPIQRRPHGADTPTRPLGRSRQQVLYRVFRNAAQRCSTKTCAPSPVSSACSIPCDRKKFAGRV